MKLSACRKKESRVLHEIPFFAGENIFDTSSVFACGKSTCLATAVVDEEGIDRIVYLFAE